MKNYDPLTTEHTDTFLSVNRDDEPTTDTAEIIELDADAEDRALAALIVDGYGDDMLWLASMIESGLAPLGREADDETLAHHAQIIADVDARYGVDRARRLRARIARRVIRERAVPRMPSMPTRGRARARAAHRVGRVSRVAVAGSGSGAAPSSDGPPPSRDDEGRPLLVVVSAAPSCAQAACADDSDGMTLSTSISALGVGEAAND